MKVKKVTTKNLIYTKDGFGRWYYYIKCDNCEEDTSTWSFDKSKREVVEYANEIGWRTVNKKVYCKDCLEFIKNESKKTKRR
ncbi:MAG: hypothetical protein QXI58_01220 [Candidatus Micrarchaeia archaeon]